MNDLAGPLYRTGLHFSILHDEQRRNDLSLGASLHQLRQAEGLVRGNMEQLFFAVCGLEDGVPIGDIEHGAMHVGSGWDSPLSSCMTYHRNLAEFAWDFVRMYLSDRCRVLVPAMLNRPGDRVWELENETARADFETDLESDIRVPGYPEPVCKGRDIPITRFLDRLDRQAAERLSNLSAEETRSLLAQAIEETPLVWLKDFGEQGAVIGTRPFSDFKRLYPKIAALAGVVPEI